MPAEVRRNTAKTAENGEGGPVATAAPDPTPDVAENADREVGPERAAVEAAAKGDTLTTQEKGDATKWFLDDDPEDTKATHSFDLRVGEPTSENQGFVTWTIQAMERERIQQIRDETRKSKPRRRGETPETDEMGANLRIATEGTIVPDLTLLKDQIPGQKFVDPADALRYRLRKKPGLIDQISVEVLRISGYDDDDIREITAVKT